MKNTLTFIMSFVAAVTVFSPVAVAGQLADFPAHRLRTPCTNENTPTNASSPDNVLIKQVAHQPVKNTQGAMTAQ